MHVLCRVLWRVAFGVVSCGAVLAGARRAVRWCALPWWHALCFSCGVGLLHCSFLFLCPLFLLGRVLSATTADLHSTHHIILLVTIRPLLKAGTRSARP